MATTDVGFCDGDIGGVLRPAAARSLPWRSAGRPRLLTAAHRCSPLLTAAHRCSSLLIAAHRCSSLLIAAHRCSSLLIAAHRCSSLLIAAHRCSSLLITAQSSGSQHVTVTTVHTTAAMPATTPNTMGAAFLSHPGLLGELHVSTPLDVDSAAKLLPKVTNPDTRCVVVEQAGDSARAAHAAVAIATMCRRAGAGDVRRIFIAA
jgi:hypothetical protein